MRIPSGASRKVRSPDRRDVGLGQSQHRAPCARQRCGRNPDRAPGRGRRCRAPPGDRRGAGRCAPWHRQRDRSGEPAVGKAVADDVARLPVSWDDALGTFERSEFIGGVFGERFRKVFAHRSARRSGSSRPSSRRSSTRPICATSELSGRVDRTWVEAFRAVLPKRRREEAMKERDVQDWLDEYGRAWVDGDPDRGGGAVFGHRYLSGNALRRSHERTTRNTGVLAEERGGGPGRRRSSRRRSGRSRTIPRLPAGKPALPERPPERGSSSTERSGLCFQVNRAPFNARSSKSGGTEGNPETCVGVVERTPVERQAAATETG